MSEFEEVTRDFWTNKAEALGNRKRLRRLLQDSNFDVDRAAVGAMLDWLEGQVFDFQVIRAKGRYRVSARVSALVTDPELVRVGVMLPEVLANVMLDVEEARRAPAVDDEADEIPMVFCPTCRGGMDRLSESIFEWHKCRKCGHSVDVDLDPDGDHC
jgi:hypothetical protein